MQAKLHRNCGRTWNTHLHKSVAWRRKVSCGSGYVLDPHVLTVLSMFYLHVNHLPGSQVAHNRRQKVSFWFCENRSTDQRLEGLRWLQIPESEMQRWGRRCSLQSMRSLVINMHLRSALFHSRAKATVRHPSRACVRHRLIRVPENMHLLLRH